MKLSSNVVSWPRFFVSHCCPAVRIRYVYDNIVRGGVSPTLHCSNMISRPCFCLPTVFRRAESPLFLHGLPTMFL